MDKIVSSRRRSNGRTRPMAGLRAVGITMLMLAALLLCSAPTVALTPDGEALLELKLAFNATAQRLTSWRPSDPNPCGWEGISCSLPDLRVQSIWAHLSLFRALHQNSLHGPIPAEIKNCTDLRAIYLRANYLQGGIPSEIGGLVHLTILDLSSNLLRGTIPASIGSLTHLRFLNLSPNFFSGEIPNVGVLGTFKSSSFVGNLELCGLPIQRACRGTLGFPAVLPNSDPLSSAGKSSISI
ncbi:putative leucine-rich repeat receptor-like protein kinase family protein [Panicum miliaceum]|uniref:Leucine-rich repeat receptor-like protein kinase family protein n=1 Tax=Panicum miliaceum TaxID=4540 RepID=A0A3L6R831_PANMI|nr:putative leucine-rich repeat receptor-like protein kinase family protein [Panicum miliaceum]